MKPAFGTGHLSRADGIINAPEVRPLSDRAVDQPVPWRARCDLILRQQDSGAWIVKDPLTLTYCLLNEQEMAVLRLLDGRRSLSEVLSLLQKGWPHLQLSTSDVTEFIGQLVQNQLLTAAASHRAAVVVSPRSASSPLAFARLFSGHLLRMQFRLLDPTRLLQRLHPLSLMLFSRQMAVFLVVLLLTALMMVTLRFDQLIENLPGPWDFFGPDNLILLAVTFVAVKALHEAGHALAARRFGAECHDAGVMFMLFTPLLYTNVTDAWILDRRSRLLITAAGMLVELALAACAVILWFFAAPGLLKALLTNVIVLCTVGTVLFNGNPLLRYDGYFLLADSIGEPNLAQRAARRVSRMFCRLLAGPYTGNSVETLSDQKKFLLLYGFCSAVYRTLLTVAILIMLLHLFDHWKLRIAGLILTSIAAIMMLAVPAFSTVTGMMAEILSLPDRGWRILRVSSILLAAVALMFVPLPCSVIVPAVVEPAGIPVYTTLAGELVSSVRYGQPLDPGTEIAVLKDPALQRQRIRFAGEVAVLEARVRAMEIQRTGQQAVQLPEVRSILESARRRLARFDEELERLTISASVRGVLMAPRKVTAPPDEVTLSAWTGYPLDEKNVGAKLYEATLLGYICHPKEAEFVLSLTDEDRELLAENQLACFQLTGHPGILRQGLIRRIAALQNDEVAAELTASGLATPLRSGAVNSENRNWQAVMRCVVNEDETQLQLYSTGQVRVFVAPQSIAERFRRFLKKTFA